MKSAMLGFEVGEVCAAGAHVRALARRPTFARQGGKGSPVRLAETPQDAWALIDQGRGTAR